MPRCTLELPGDTDAFEQRTHAFQRAGWWCMLGIVAAACAGVFGHGPLSRASSETSSGAASIEFERFVRAGAVQTWRCTLNGHAPIHLSMNRDYLERMDEVMITPQPSEEHGSADAVTYVFAGAMKGEMAREQEIVVLFRARPRGAGGIRCEVRFVADAAPSGPRRDEVIVFDQFIYP